MTRQLLFEQKEAERLATLNELKTRFFTNISHEFRTPLTLLVGPIDDLQKKYPQENIIALMQRNLKRLQILINQLLDLSKLEAGEMKASLQDVNLSLFFEHIFASFESLAQSKFIIFNHSQSHLHQLGRFDLDKLEKIIINLLSNAFKFTPKNGRIIVRVDYKVIGEIGQLFIRVQDFGMGIPTERLPHIFDRFYQVDDSNQRQHDGTGIGLALVKELINLLDGEIQVSSRLGEGTTFELALPFVATKMIENELEKTNSKTATIFETEFTNKSIQRKIIETDGQNIMLIIEDNADLRNYIGSFFESKYQLIMAVDGVEGLRKAIEYIPDIVICDLMMPNLDGLEFCEKLKNDERINHIPVIMLTAKATLADKLVGLGKGADDYLSKPFNREELTVRVNNLVTQRQLMREKFTLLASDNTQVEKIIKELTIDDLFIQKAKNIIDKYLDKSEFDVDTFANEMTLSSVQLRRKLKAITNQTVTEFVRNYRLEIAADKLQKGFGSVSEIAYQVGFDSLPYFSKVFLERYGKTPSDWK
ncbi:hybrid sensor histidine kinase/response regulator transcription factor [Arcicella aurantiaca]|uniref:hybrid sensor histidine kinase/response regulator transcription factor n=1 Tax=Arcicella aurantiaca TaxID=591202 RepID=UPI0011B1C9BB|nr:ATP-binding protein [Arcicella aurantiaca]